MRMSALKKYFCSLLLVILPAFAGDGAKPEELFPETTLFAAALPDLESARKAFSSSRLGELFSQAEMREFIDPIVAKIKAAYNDNRPFQPAIPSLDDIDKGLLNGEVSVCIYSRGAGFEPGVIFSLVPKDMKAFESLLKPVLKGQPLPQGEPFPLGGAGEEAPGALIMQGRITVCKPMPEIALVADRANDAAKRTKETLSAFAPFAAGRAALHDPAAWFYVNPKGIAELADDIANKRNEKAMAKKLLSAFGLENLNSLFGSLTINAKEVSAEFFAGMPEGAAPGLFNVRPIEKELLQVAAENAPFVEAASMDFARILPAIREVIGALAPDPNALQNFDKGLMQVNGLLQFDLQKDLLSNIEPAFVMTQTPRETGVPLTFNPGMVGVAKIKDPMTVERCMQKLKDTAEAMMGHNVPALFARFATTKYKGTTIYYFNQILQGANAFCVSKNMLVYGNSVNAVKRGLDQLSSGTNILSNKDFQTAIARVSGQPFDAAKLPASFSYSIDTGGGGSELFLTLAGLALETGIVAGMSEGIQQGKQLEGPPPGFEGFAMIPNVGPELSRPGVRAALNVLSTVDLNLWPDEEFFVKYRGAHASASTRGKDGWLVRSDLPPPMPVMNNGGALVPVAIVAVGAAVALPVLARARDAARRVANTGNLKQIGVAMMNYAAAHNDALPNKGEDLFPQYVNDLQVFKSSSLDAAQDIHYYIVPGLRVTDGAILIAAYENDPPSKVRAVLFADGHVESLEEAAFNATLDQTARALKASGRKFEPVGISLKALMAKKK